MQRGWVASADYQAVIRAIRSIREGKGLSQRELARRVGKPPSFINKTELRERRLDILEFITLAQAMDMSAIDLLEAVVAALAASQAQPK